MTASRKVLIVFVALIAVVASAASGSESESGDSKGSDTTAAATGGSTSTPDSSAKSAGDAGEVDDVKINSCGKDDTIGYAQANITVTNDSSKASDYMIEITFTSKDGKTQVGTGNSFIQNLAPGQTKTEDVSALEEAGDLELVCTVSSVSRTESL